MKEEEITEEDPFSATNNLMEQGPLVELPVKKEEEEITVKEEQDDDDLHMKSEILDHIKTENLDY